MKDYLEDKNKIDIMSFLVFHKIRGPIATMQGLLELVKMEALKKEEACQVYSYFTKCVNELDLSCKELSDFLRKQNQEP